MAIGTFRGHFPAFIEMRIEVGVTLPDAAGESFSGLWPSVCMLEWNIQSRGHICFVTGRHFVEGEAYYTVLLDQRHGFERLDLSREAWPTHSGEILARPNFISHWQGVYHAPPPVPPEAIRRDDAESLLRKLVERRDESHAAACYILAVMLERKRVLKVKQQLRENGRRVFIYEHAKSGDVFAIADPELHLEQLEAVQRDVGQLLEHGLPGEDGPVAGVPVEEPFNPPSEITTLAPA